MKIIVINSFNMNSQCRNFYDTYLPQLGIVPTPVTLYPEDLGIPFSKVGDCNYGAAGISAENLASFARQMEHHIATLPGFTKDDFRFFMNANNYSHEISALLAGFCFKYWGNPSSKKVILNFDHHQDSAFSSTPSLKYSTWGNCIHNADYRKAFNTGEIQYAVLGTKSTDLPAGPGNPFSKLIEPGKKTDVFITIDRDVHTGSATIYGDGFFTFDQVFAGLKYFLETHSQDINLCGMDITGFPQFPSGCYQEGGVKKYLELTGANLTPSCPRLMTDLDGQITRVLELVKPYLKIR